jgi:bifunctional DNA-binding transcriptional regulator/antitoxin component of YhaV-PrlF toxin-antitoxin module
MGQSGELRVSARGQMSLPATARRRWHLDAGGEVGYLDLGDAVLIVPRLKRLRRDVFASVRDEDWAKARGGFGDPDLATE